MRIVLALLLLTVSTAALAYPQCTNAPADKWMSPEAMKQKIAAMGHRIDVFKTTKGNCYEIYGRNSARKRIEVYFDPVTGEIVRETGR